MPDRPSDRPSDADRPRVFLADAKPPQNFDDVFVVANKQLAESRNGKAYLKALVSDRTLQVPARMWDVRPEWFEAMPEGPVRLTGKVELYQDNLQFVIERFDLVKVEDIDLSDLLPATEKDVDAMFARVGELCRSVSNKPLRALLDAFLGDERLMGMFRRAPAAVSMHHAFLGGLLEHTLNAMEVAAAIAPFYPGLNRDLVVAGVFLHDLGKTYELRYDAAFSYTDGGNLVGHVAKGAMMVEDKARAAARTLGEPFPRRLTEVVQHIVLSHHGTREFGAAVLPQTPEAMAVHLIENLDSKLIPALAATRGRRAGAGDWTDYNKSAGVRLYRPDVAPPGDAPPQGGPADVPPPVSAAPEPKPERSEVADKPAFSNPLFGELSGKR